MQPQHEPIEVDTRYMWEAVYDDGAESLREWERAGDGDVIKHWFRDIEVERTTGFILHDLGREGGPQIAVQLSHSSEQRLIFFRRHATEFNMQTGETIQHEPVHVVGWQKTVGGHNVSVYLFVFPDGSFLLTDRHNPEEQKGTVK